MSSATGVIGTHERTKRRTRFIGTRAFVDVSNVSSTRSKKKCKKNVCFRCKSFQSVKRGEICRIPGCSVSPSAPGTPTPVRLPQFQGDTFKQFVNYVYTGKVRARLINVFQTESRMRLVWTMTSKHDTFNLGLEIGSGNCTNTRACGQLTVRQSIVNDNLVYKSFCRKIVFLPKLIN